MPCNPLLRKLQEFCSEKCSNFPPLPPIKEKELLPNWRQIKTHPRMLARMARGEERESCREAGDMGKEDKEMGEMVKATKWFLMKLM